ncbi:hypothetical protein Cgig2_000975 [Carnegiea gigantea]|uniref:Uncharacterized protein n=1 Tax=Carnegiea gigantea TaxID=171969 RepID=A0A9Q1JEE7_9CARY|nr:hypothetical protein Cgig2_000975 [Carnegiea gigantea]
MIEQFKVLAVAPDETISPTQSTISLYTIMADPDEDVLCSVLGLNPPLEVIEGFIRRICRTFDIDKICVTKEGVFLVRDDCRKKSQSRIEWRLVIRQEPQELAPPHLHIDEEGFITVRKRATTTATGSKDLSTVATTAPTPVRNSFEMLVANEGNEVMLPIIEGGPPHG